MKATPEPPPAPMPEPVHPSIALAPARKWAITGSVMLVTIMQILDTSITNVALPHMQGTLSTSVEDRHALPGHGRAGPVLTYGDVYFMLTVIFAAVVLLLPWMRRIRVEQTGPQAAAGRVEGLPEPAPE